MRAAPETAMPLFTGQTLAHYRLLDLLGGGGMGQVFRAEDMRLQRHVAIKFLHQDTSEDTSRRLLREARAAAALSHPSIVTIYSVEEAENHCFIVMELVEGATLADRLASGPVDLTELCNIGAQLGDALAAAHTAGIVHHDITPRNILLAADGRAKLGDFGLSQRVGPRNVSSDSTRTNLTGAGTLYYMSPEQARGESAAARSDMFSFGAVLYHAATGRRPFEGANAFAVLDAIVTIDPPPPSAVRAGLPPTFDALLGRLMAKRVEDRSIGAGEAADTLRRIAASLSVSGPSALDSRRGTPRDNLPFVGRTRELAQLSAAFSRASAGTGTTIVITGDAGMGKTALLDAFLHTRETRAANAIVCRGQSIEHSGAGEAYFPVLDALTPVVAYPGYGLHESVRTHAPSWHSQFRGVYANQEVASTSPTPARLARELGDALSAAARSRPLVLILEDVHWADPSTIELLRHLAHRATRIALLLIATCRGEEAAAAGSSINQAIAELEARGICDTIELSRLDEATLREYLDRRFGDSEVLAQLASLLFKSTEGHPLFAVSLVQLFIQRGDLQHTGQAWQLTTPIDRLRVVIPRTVEAVIRRKLAALEDADRRLLQHASIEGQEFSTAVLSALTGDDPAALEERLEALAKGPRLVAVVGPERYVDATWGARYQFAHAVYHNLVYQDLPPSRRADLHRQVGDRLLTLHAGRTTAIAAQLARHFKEGRNWERAFEYDVEAGDNSMMLSATLEAEGHYSQAIGLAGADGTDIDPRRVAIAYYKRALTRVSLGNYSLALLDYHEALAGASKVSDQDLMFEIRLAIAYLHGFDERIDDAIKAAGDLEKDVEPPPGGLKRLSYLILDLQLKTSCGDLGQAALAGDTAIALARSLSNNWRLQSSLCVRARIHYYQAEYESALTQLREVCSSPGAGTRLPDPRPRHVHFSGVQFLGLTLTDLGRISEALAILQPALETARTDASVSWIPILLNVLGWLYGEIGELDAALCHAEEASHETVARNTEVVVESRLGMAAACSRLGHLDRASSLLDEADTLTRQRVPFEWLWRIHFCVIAGEHALARRAAAAASDHAREAAALARGCGAWKHVVIAERLLAAAAELDGDWVQATAHVQEAADLLRSHPVPIAAWKVHATAARIHQRRGRPMEAALELELARGGVCQLAENIHEERLKATFLESDDVRQVLGGSAMTPSSGAEY